MPRFGTGDLAASDERPFYFLDDVQESVTYGEFESVAGHLPRSLALPTITT